MSEKYLSLHDFLMPDVSNINSVDSQIFMNDNIVSAKHYIIEDSQLILYNKV